jgi:predicted O-methyltransferase YrrM
MHSPGWQDYDADTIYNRVTSRVAPGSIVLFHNAALHTPAGSTPRQPQKSRGHK